MSPVASLCVTKVICHVHEWWHELLRISRRRRHAATHAEKSETVVVVSLNSEHSIYKSSTILKSSKRRHIDDYIFNVFRKIYSRTANISLYILGLGVGEDLVVYVSDVFFHFIFLHAARWLQQFYSMRDMGICHILLAVFTDLPRVTTVKHVVLVVLRPIRGGMRGFEREKWAAKANSRQEYHNESALHQSRNAHNPQRAIDSNVNISRPINCIFLKQQTYYYPVILLLRSIFHLVRVNFYPFFAVFFSVLSNSHRCMWYCLPPLCALGFVGANKKWNCIYRRVSICHFHLNSAGQYQVTAVQLWVGHCWRIFHTHIALYIHSTAHLLFHLEKLGIHSRQARHSAVPHICAIPSHLQLIFRRSFSPIRTVKSVASFLLSLSGSV